MTIGIVGATGAVGQEIVRLLEEREFPLKKTPLLSLAEISRKNFNF